MVARPTQSPHTTSLIRKATTERLILGLQLTAAMLAAGLLVIAVAWEFVFPERAAVAELVAGAAAILVAVPVIASAWHSLLHPSLHGVTDLLIAVAVVGAWASGDLLTAALLPIVMILGHVLEERSLLGSREAIRALTKLAETSARRKDADGTITETRTQDLAIGDTIVIRAGDRVPVDGIVSRGAASLDMASLTGESVPVEVGAGDTVLAGSINVDGHLDVVVTRVGADTTLGKIIALVRSAERAKPPSTRLLERYATQYLALVLMISAGTWFATGRTDAMLAVLVASCPCALVLAAPSAAIAAIAVAARHGILIKGTPFLENLVDVDSAVFDKTGTLTLGELTIARIVPAVPDGEAELTALAAGLGVASTHPVSRAAARACPEEARKVIENAREAGGFGVTGTCDGQPVALGRPDLFARLGIEPPPVPVHEGPVAGVSIGSRFLGWLLFADSPRPEAVAALEDLRALGLNRQILLTGDRLLVAKRIAALLMIDDVWAEALPEQKMLRVQQEIAAGHLPLVVGDGINDTLALKAGAIGIAMGAQGTDVALASADLVLMTSDLTRIGTAIRLSRRCRSTIQINVVIGLGWTVVLVALAATGLLGSQGAIVAALLHNLATLIGLGNSGRLLLFDELSDGAKAPAN